MTANTNTVNAVFRNHTIPDEQASKTAGRPIFTDMEVVDLTFPANGKTKATFPAHEAEPNATRESVAVGGGLITYAMLYNQQYQAFKSGNAQPISGTPLSEAPFLMEGKRRELMALNVKTVEQLASLDGTPLKQLGMGGRELKNQAQAYLDNAAGSADVTGLAAEVAALRQQLAEERQLRLEYMDAATAKRVVNDPDGIPPSDELPGNGDDDEPIEPDHPLTAEEIESLDDASLKDFIAKETGSRPKGNPSHATLVAAAKELAMVA